MDQLKRPVDMPHQEMAEKRERTAFCPMCGTSEVTIGTYDELTPGGYRHWTQHCHRCSFAPVVITAPPANGAANGLNPSATVTLTLAKAAARTGLSPRNIERLVAERRLPHLKVGRLLRFYPDDLDAFMDACRIEATSRPSTDG